VTFQYYYNVSVFVLKRYIIMIVLSLETKKLIYFPMISDIHPVLESICEQLVPVIAQ